MDPNTALEEMRKCAANIIRSVDAHGVPSDEDAERLAEHVQALDEWLSKGGFLPREWANR